MDDQVPALAFCVSVGWISFQGLWRQMSVLVNLLNLVRVLSCDTSYERLYHGTFGQPFDSESSNLCVDVPWGTLPYQKSAVLLVVRNEEAVLPILLTHKPLVETETRYGLDCNQCLALPDLGYVPVPLMRRQVEW